MNLRSLIQDPPPSLAFEISEAGIAVARIRPRGETAFHPFKPGIVSPSPLHDNILVPDEFTRAVRALAGSNGTRKHREAALILPDNCARISVLDFDEFPSDRKEQLSLVRFRIRKSIPFDVESAAVSYWPQPVGGKKHDVVVAVAPLEVVTRYEAPFRAAGLVPGLVTSSGLAMLELVNERGLTIVAKRAGRVLTVFVLDKGFLKLVRCLEMVSADLAEVDSHLYPTFVFVEDHFGARAETLLLCGFGDKTEDARQRFQSELAIPVEPVRSPLGMPGENNAGLLGYLRSVEVNA